MKLLDLRLLPGEKATRAFVDLEINGLIVRDFRVYQINRIPTVQNPFNTYKDREGKLTFREIISLPAAVQAEAHALVLGEYFRRIKGATHGKQPHP
jgi:hypothetical protein